PAIAERKSISLSLEKIFSPQRMIMLLRMSLAATFFWFGLLKVINASPVVNMLAHSFTLFATPPFLQLLGIGEVAIAIGLAIKRFSKFTAVLMVLHLLGTLSVAFISPQLIFAPKFPLLTMDGEFLVKNFVLISAGLAVFSARE